MRYAPTAYICGEHEIALVVSLLAQCTLVEAVDVLCKHFIQTAEIWHGTRADLIVDQSI